MKENIVFRLRELIGDSSAFGNDKGREVFQKLLFELDAYPSKNIFGISLSGISMTDASFPRESVISLAKSRKGEKGFYLQDFASPDLLDNWDYAAKAKNQTIIVFIGSSYKLIGSDISPGSKDLLDFVMRSKTVTTSKVAKHFNVTAQNASAKLKKLLSLGLILGTKREAESGGIEFLYTAIQKNR